jgi:hypothetical protein
VLLSLPTVDLLHLFVDLSKEQKQNILKREISGVMHPKEILTPETPASHATQEKCPSVCLSQASLDGFF